MGAARLLSAAGRALCSRADGPCCSQCLVPIGAEKRRPILCGPSDQLQHGFQLLGGRGGVQLHSLAEAALSGTAQLG